MMKDIYGQINELFERQTAAELAQLNVIDHEFFVERQTYKNTVFFVFHTHVATVVFVSFVGFIITTKFSIAYFRVFNRLE
jgi:hypothetical protein